MRRVACLSCFVLAAASALGAGRPMTVDDLLAVTGVADPQISPDGQSVVYVVSEIDREAGKTNSSLWMVALDGGEPKRLTTTPGTNSHPRWSPDGKTIAFVSDRGGSPQVWLLPIDGGEPRQLTDLPIGVSGPIWSPPGDKIAFTARVYPGKTPEETAEQDKSKAEAKSQVKIYDQLMVRHWDTWDDGKRSHLFVADAETGEARDLTPDLKVNTPPAPFGGSNEYAFSADGREIAFTAEPIEDRFLSTNTDIWVVSVEGGEPRNLTQDNPGADAQPSYSPDGQFLAFVSQKRAGFESDQWVLKVVPLHGGGAAYSLSTHWDRPVLSFVWGEPGRSDSDDLPRLFAVIDDEGTVPIVEIPFGGIIRDGPSITIVPSLETKRLVRGGVNTSIQFSPKGDTLVFLRHQAHRPAEVVRAKVDGSDITDLSRHNAPLLNELDLPEAESFTFEGAGGDTVQGWLIRPPGFDASKTYPVVFLIHGGPQGAWHDEWHPRWNYPLFASPGYALVAINPRGSTGFGQTFTDQISQDWTGKVYEDLMLGLDHALAAYPFLDGAKVAAAGASYGGFMVNWIAGQTDRFQALVSHAGVFDLPSMYFTTEELWFPEWEFGGTPWTNPRLYEEQTPSRFVANFRTPTLVLHGAHDFRVPDTQGLAMFTALQRQGVPSRFVYFPDENHWILKPENRVVWWREVHDWLAKYLKPPAESSPES